MDNRERVEHLYLNDRNPPFSLVRLPSGKAVKSSVELSTRSSSRAAPKYAVNPTSSDRSIAGSSSRQSEYHSISRRSSASSAPSIHVAPPWHPDPPRNMTRIAYSYDLPCEFGEIFGCGVSFSPEQFRDWIDHGASHFMAAGPPQTSVCIFCDHGSFRSWEERMVHMGNHYQYGTTRSVRPDFFVIQQLYRGTALTRDEYDHYMGYTERPSCDNLVELGYKTPEQEAREERERAEPLRRQNYGNVLATEDRQMRKEKREGRMERSSYKPCKKSQVYIS